MELLAPAGSFDALKAAVSSGADAVYFGGTALNARVFGKNFTDEELVEASNYCKAFGVKSYLTLNTLVSDNELKKIIPFLEMVNSSNVTAVIVQDLGLAKLIKSVAPSLPIHASTQMTIHNLNGVKQAEKLGFSRVVLSRELPESELKYISQNSPLELEAFIHGALCMCYSGQCYMSSVIGERSGNRGKCAQPCRKEYRNGYELSLKDLCMAGDFERFLNLNIHSLKIEGRMKSPDYVSGVVSVYRKLIDEKRNATADEMKFLADLFSRDGFTNDYFYDIPSKKMFGIRTEKDKEKSREVSASYEQKKIEVYAEFSAKSGQNIKLTLRKGEHIAEVFAPPAYEAQNKAVTAEDCQKQIEKLGGTKFVLKSFEADIDENLFIPMGVLNNLRRECVEKLEKYIEKCEKREFFNKIPQVNSSEQNEKIIAYCETDEQAIAVGEKADLILMPLSKIKQNYFEKTVAVLPEIIFDREFEEIKNMLENCRKLGIDKVVCNNLGQIEWCRNEGFEAHGGTGLNLFNSLALEEMKEMGLKSAVLSFEMNFAQIRDLKKPLPVYVFAYGRYPVMTLQNCLMKNRGECIDFNGYSMLKDETGREFPVFCRPPHRNAVYNAIPLYMGDKQESFNDLGKLFFFTTESGKEVKEIFKMYNENSLYNKPFTRGFFNKKV